VSRSITPQNIAGLVVGEGCFYAESAADPKYRSGWRIRPAFCIEMRHDERETLEAVRDALGCGGIYHLDFGRYRGYGKKRWAPHAKYRVSKLGDLHDKVIPFFQEYTLFGRKKHAFECFVPIVELLITRAHLEPEGLERAKMLARRLAIHNSGDTSDG
jgi:LAGLIDADG endonuclease